MGLLNFFKKGNKANNNIAGKTLNSISENISKWSKPEKVLLFALLVEIALADDNFCETEKEVLGIKLFGVGVLDEIMEIQVAADLIYSKGNIGDIEKIATDFNKLNMIKKDYVIKSISEMIEADGTTNQREIEIAKKLTGGLYKS